MIFALTDSGVAGITYSLRSEPNWSSRCHRPYSTDVVTVVAVVTRLR